MFSERGDVFGWGNSEYGQLASVAGGGTQVNVSRHLPFSSNTTFVKVAAAGTMCALIDGKYLNVTCVSEIDVKK
jgi:hypothetical protein